jgi:deferrochelatase/peroxidase EfeB
MVSLYGPHQAGIATGAQDRLAFAAFDLTTLDPMAVQTLLGLWAAAAAQMSAGRPVGPPAINPEAPPLDTGEALGLPPANLTITVGFGPSMFDDRFGLSSRRPAALVDLPAFPNDQLQKSRSGGDIGVQACSNDPQVAFHVIRNFARMARGTAVLRWTQLGFGRTSSTSTTQATARNLMGFKDGTRNLKVEDPGSMSRSVWVAPGDLPGSASWMAGGSYLVSRRIRMIIETWDRDVLSDQENVFGRAKASGGPLSGGDEFAAPDFHATLAGGVPAIPMDAHIRLAAPENNNGTAILRRSYSYTDGVDSRTGMLDAGLFFIAYMRSPAQFVRLQSQLGAHDALNEYIQHTSSALFACPPGVAAGNTGDYWGRALFEA